MTEKLFYEDSHLSEFEAEVLSCLPSESVRGKYEVKLDRTAFFPEGGGQYADTGSLAVIPCGLEEEEGRETIVRILDVQEKEGRILHLADGPLAEGCRVKGCIDWDERFMKMQQHTGEHIVSGIIHARFGYNNVGFHLGSEDCTMDFNGGITEGELGEIELAANRAVWANLPVVTLYPSRDELEKMEYRSKIEIEGQVRIIEIPGYDRCACCAPHVDRTGEIGMIKLTNVQRYKGGVRVTMLCGVRALRDYEVKQKQAKEVSAMLCAKENETAEAVRHLKEECAALKGGLAEQEKKLIQYQAERIPAGEDAVCVFSEDLRGDSLRILMNCILDAGHKLCAVMGENSGKKGEKSGGNSAADGGDVKTYRYVIGSRSVDVRPLAKEFNARFGGRGGGKPEMVQGTVQAVVQAEAESWILEKAGEL